MMDHLIFVYGALSYRQDFASGCPQPGCSIENFNFLIETWVCIVGSCGSPGENISL